MLEEKKQENQVIIVTYSWIEDFTLSILLGLHDSFALWKFDLESSCVTNARKGKEREAWLFPNLHVAFTPFWSPLLIHF